ALSRLGPSAHHRRFFAPVVAARDKHQPATIERDLLTRETPAGVEVAAAI
ncbi:MAG: ribonuclease HII, partial [Bradyrhizobium sp.]|nr:ribonuclease HII [Bradyrhizobium sp.]